MGHVCECWKVMRSWCAAFALTTRGLSVAPTMGKCHKCTQLCSQRLHLFWHSPHVSLCSKIKVWDLQAALDPRAPASTLCLRTLVVGSKVLVLPESLHKVSPQILDLKLDGRPWSSFWITYLTDNTINSKIILLNLSSVHTCLWWLCSYKLTYTFISLL